MKLPLAVTTLAVTAALALTACDSPEGLGAISGAGAGALFGSRHGHDPVRSAAIGAGAGALIGHLIGRANDRGYYEGRRYPYGRYVGRGYVESPYRPYNIINTRGIPSGAVVEDPSTGGRFINP